MSQLNTEEQESWLPVGEFGMSVQTRPEVHILESATHWFECLCERNYSSHLGKLYYNFNTETDTPNHAVSWGHMGCDSVRGKQIIFIFDLIFLKEVR